LSFDQQGNLNQIANLQAKKSTLIKQSFCYYNSFQGNNSEPEFQPSGAYIFRPLSNTPTCLTASNFTVYRGLQFDEITQTFNDWITQKIRLYTGADHAEFNWQVGPIDVTNQIGKEVIVRFDSDLDSQATFYTDSNGREVLKRVRDFRPSWNFTQSEPVAGNYYPVNSRIFIRDVKEDSQLTLVTDRSEGGSSVQDGSLELMLHRITLNDDSLGVGEPLNEKGSDGKGLVVNGKVRLVFSSVAASARIHRQLAHAVNSGPVAMFVGSYARQVGAWGTGGVELPANLHLLTLMNDVEAGGNVVLARVEHFYEEGEDAEMSVEVVVDVRKVFGRVVNVVGVEEMALGGNMGVGELDERLEWRREGGPVAGGRPREKGFVFAFRPMQIRTFRLWYEDRI